MVVASGAGVGMRPLKRAVKLWGIEGTPEFKEAMKGTFRCLNDISKVVWRALRDEKIKIMSSWYVDLFFVLYDHQGYMD